MTRRWAADGTPATYKNYGRAVPSQGKLITELQRLLIRVHRFATVRAQTPEEHRWARHAYDKLEEILNDRVSTSSDNL